MYLMLPGALRYTQLMFWTVIVLLLKQLLNVTEEQVKARFSKSFTCLIGEQVFFISLLLL